MRETHDDFLERTNREYAEFCARTYKLEELDASGQVSLHGLWAWQERDNIAKAENERLTAALQAIKIRLHFMGWPAEAMFNAGTEDKPKWIPDWRYEIALIENALHGTPMTKEKYPTDTTPHNKIKDVKKTRCIKHGSIAHRLYCAIECKGDPECFFGLDEATQARWIDGVNEVIGKDVVTEGAQHSSTTYYSVDEGSAGWTIFWPDRPGYFYGFGYGEEAEVRAKSVCRAMNKERQHWLTAPPSLGGEDAALAPEDGSNWIDRAAFCAREIAAEIGDTIQPERSTWGDGIKHAKWMAIELSEKRIKSEAKACRWLGYLQGLLVALRWSTLEKEKARNLRSGVAALKGKGNDQET